MSAHFWQAMLSLSDLLRYHLLHTEWKTLHSLAMCEATCPTMLFFSACMNLPSDFIMWKFKSLCFH